jgi:hypothetical protein
MLIMRGSRQQGRGRRRATRDIEGETETLKGLDLIIEDDILTQQICFLDIA